MFLDFEKPIEDIEEKILSLKNSTSASLVDLNSDIEKLQLKKNTLVKKIFSKLTPWQITQVARHPMRPYTKDYIDNICDSFIELHGDRTFADDQSIIAGLAKIDNIRCVIIGNQKGRDTKEKIKRNFGMSKPEGYRKALRIMKIAEKFNLPIITLIDTPGAYPGIDAEKRGQSEAIGRNIFEMSDLKIPIISIIIGEGGSGGALALSVADKIMMLQYSIYSVISPEGCASILWKDAKMANKAADILGITSERLLELGLIDSIIEEPIGGAHRNRNEIYKTIKNSIKNNLETLQQPVSQLLKSRQYKLNNYGSYIDQ
jgi:acetyl-CoA carboxylase carboxyl transferase subunit alpha